MEQFIIVGAVTPQSFQSYYNSFPDSNVQATEFDPVK